VKAWALSFVGAECSLHLINENGLLTHPHPNPPLEGAGIELVDLLWICCLLLGFALLCSKAQCIAPYIVAQH
jgi:hypothetical protein